MKKTVMFRVISAVLILGLITIASYNTGHSQGYGNGVSDGTLTGYAQGKQAGFNSGYDKGVTETTKKYTGKEIADGVFELILKGEGITYSKEIYICLNERLVNPLGGEIHSVEGVYLGSKDGKEFLVEEQDPSPARFEYWPVVEMYCDHMDLYSETDWIPHKILTGILLEPLWYQKGVGRYIKVRDDEPLLPQDEGAIIDSSAIEFRVASCAHSRITGDWGYKQVEPEIDTMRAYVWMPGEKEVLVVETSDIEAKEDNTLLLNFSEQLPSGAYVFLDACGYSYPTVGPMP